MSVEHIETDEDKVYILYIFQKKKKNRIDAPGSNESGLQIRKTRALVLFSTRYISIGDRLSL